MLKSKIRISTQSVLALLFLAYILFVGTVNPTAFFSLGTLYDMLRSSSVYGILALGLLPIIILGGVDISFSAIGAFSTYVTVTLILRFELASLPIGIIYLIAIVIGTILGTLNGLLVARLKIPVLVVTLGTSAMLSGFLLFVFGSTVIYTLPDTLDKFSKITWLTVQNNGISSSLHPAIVISLGVSIFIAIMLKYTFIGRNIYAMGGDASVFERSGYSRKKVEVIVFALSGALAAIAGITYAALYRIVNPAMFLGEELDVIAMVVLGGAAITGGVGSVIGTLIGVMFINLLKNSLILINISSAWQVFVVGVVLFLGVCIPILYEKQQHRIFKGVQKNGN